MHAKEDFKKRGNDFGVFFDVSWWWGRFGPDAWVFSHNRCCYACIRRSTGEPYKWQSPPPMQWGDCALSLFRWIRFQIPLSVVSDSWFNKGAEAEIHGRKPKHTAFDNFPTSKMSGWNLERDFRMGTGPWGCVCACQTIAEW